MGWIDSLRTIGMNDGQKLFVYAKDIVDILKIEYKTLPEEGKLEAIIFSSIFALKAYKQNHPENYDEAKKIFYTLLYQQEKNTIKNSDKYFFIIFLNERIKLYNEEIKEMYNQQEGYIPGVLLNNFYESPLTAYPVPSDNLGEVLLFFQALTTAIKKIDNLSSKL